MPNVFSLNGAQSQQQTKFAPIYTGRWSDGIWTNRSPLRDAATTRLTEKFYGAAGDALIAGNNVEITNRLTLARRPGNSIYDSNNFTSVDRYYDFRLFSATTEQIIVMVDQASALYSLYAGVKNLVWTKNAAAGQSYMQSVGNSLYWGDGVDDKKWLQSLTQWAANASWNGSNTPFYSTFFIDPNGNIQQLTGTGITVQGVVVSSDILTITADQNLEDILSVDDVIQFPASMTATFLEGQSVTITAVSGDTFTADLVNPDYSNTEAGTVIAVELTGEATPISGSTEPTWSTVVPSSENNFQGGVTLDGTVEWTNRGNPVENWGLANGTKPIKPVIGASTVSWRANTYFSLPGVVIDANGNLQQVKTVGISGSTVPTWATSVGDETTDSSVTWVMIQTAASMVWQPNTAYTPSSVLLIASVANASSGSTVYTGTITGGASNAFAGKTFVVIGFTNATNNGTYLCTASSDTTLTLQNALGIAEVTSGTATTNGAFVVSSAYGTPCLFQAGPIKQPTISGNVSAYIYDAPHTGAVGCFIMANPTSTGSALDSDTTLNSLSFFGVPDVGVGPIYWNTVNGAGQGTGSTVPFPSFSANFQLIILTTMNFPAGGQYTFTIRHHDGMIWGMGGGVTLVSGTNDNPLTGPGQPQTVTANQAYPVLGGTNRGLESGGLWTDTFTVNVPAAGPYPVEIDYAYWYHSGIELDVQCNGFELANGAPLSSSTAPVWPSWSTSFAPNYPSVTEAGGVLAWNNLGPASDFTWAASTGFTLPDTTIFDANGNIEAPYRTGITGTVAPTFQTGLNQLTPDNPNLIWINEGTATTPPSGTVSTFNGGWSYTVALVNTLDNTVSNGTPVSAATGNFVGVTGITIPPGAGLPPLSKIDPQADFVAIFRTTDGQSTPFLIPGTYTTYTVPLSVYLTAGYTDTTPDTGLNNLISAAINGENTPPAAGAQNLAFHLNRIFFSIGNVVYWTAGPDTPVGNGVNGVPPLNFDTFPSLVRRIVPTASGAMVFTVSDVYLIQGSGTASSPIQSGLPIMEGIGILSYNALDINGSLIGFFTTDNQFLIIDPSSGVSYAGFPIGDQFRLNNGTPGQSWNSSSVYVAWHVEGEDQAWYVADGQNGWYKLIPTPAPEQGYTWSPFATIVGGCKAVQSIETTPGVHKLLLGSFSTGPTLNRNLNTWEDNGEVYPANAVVGSAVLAQPGQVAVVSFVTTESVKTGTPLNLGFLIDEALPYYTGGFDIIKSWENDPPNLKPSRSFWAQRFYLAEIDEAAACRHLQIKVIWAAENAQNELTSLTVFGGFLQEE
jgi:hypothetical protein